ncbi:hypothetical protein [Streptomyces sp. NPDC003522]
MSYRDTPTPWALDKRLSDKIGAYLIRYENEPRDAFYQTVDDALFAEDTARLHGTYPPAGHGYPREDM